FNSDFFSIAKAMYENQNISNNYYTNYSLIPVGSDWTDNRNIIGYYDPFNKEYKSTPTLDLILEAEQNQNIPFFLILDEMNLSHVERYFSDFLSAMESGEPIPLHSLGEMVLSDSGNKIPNSIKIPNNVFITGTVNIDETTYMFSPKVLDRANVIEFKFTKDDLEKYLNGESEKETANGDSSLAEQFLEISRRARGIENDKLPDPENFDKIKDTIKEVFNILDGSGQEFAYRTAGEIIRYTKVSFYIHNQIDENKDKPWDWKVAMDEQILQKVLPKLHGNRKKMQPILEGLAYYCLTGKLKLKDETSEDSNEQKKETIFKNSYSKVNSMLTNLQRDGFVSFIE
ncbi:MAG: hypothetical protein KDK36_21355, partial [Leptospiraceae bacterium]|nr:hypothetical protein [Leptospiraceae bacterium]